MVKTVEERDARGMLCPLTFGSQRDGPAELSGEVFGCMATRCMWWVETGRTTPTCQAEPVGKSMSIGYCGGSPAAAAAVRSVKLERLASAVITAIETAGVPPPLFAALHEWDAE